MIRKFALSVVAALIVSAPALAADLKGPVYKAAPAAFNWNGLYFGGHVGYGDGEAIVNPAAPLIVAGIDGVFGGVQIGFNRHLSRNWVVGLEADISFSDINGPVPAPGVGAFSNNWFGTVRGRLGYAFDRVLVYGTGGVAYGNNTANNGVLSIDQTHFGWAAGAGVELALNRMWSVKFEYLHIDLGSETYFAAPAAAIPVEFNTFRVGVNYRW